jgi:hypothetical protein
LRCSSPVRKGGYLAVIGFFLEEGYMCLPQFGFVAGVVVASCVMFAEILVHSCFLIWYGILSLEDRDFAEGVGPNGDH